MVYYNVHISYLGMLKHTLCGQGYTWAHENAQRQERGHMGY